MVAALRGFRLYRSGTLRAVLVSPRANLFTRLHASPDPGRVAEVGRIEPLACKAARAGLEPATLGLTIRRSAY